MLILKENNHDFERFFRLSKLSYAPLTHYLACVMRGGKWDSNVDKHELFK